MFGKKNAACVSLDYSRVEVDLVVRLGRRKASAHEDVVVHFEPTQPNPGRNEVDAVRSARPKGKKCRL